MEKTLRRALTGISILLLLPWVFTEQPRLAYGAETFKIGETNPFSGPAAYLGTVYHEGTKFVVDEYNAKGGLLGKKIEIITEDNEFKPDMAVRKVKKMILEDKVNIFGSGTGSHIAIALNKVAASYKVIGVNYGFSQVLEKKDFNRYYFRAGYSPYTVTAGQALLLGTTPHRKIYMIYQDYAYGHAMAKYFKDNLKAHVPDAVIVGEDAHPLGLKDYAPYINKVIASKADCVWSSNFGVDAYNLVKQARVLGLKVPFPFVTHVGEELSYVNTLKEDAVGILNAHPYGLRIDTPENQQIIQKWHELHKKDKDPMLWWPGSAIGATIMNWKMILAAVEKAGSFDPEKIVQVFEGFRYKSPVGWFEMRKEDHQLNLPMFGSVIESKNPYYDGSIRPDMNFPWPGPKVLPFPAEKVAAPLWYQ
jgi:branched-chain amino acid transport system substrate-binding protein